jgi:hypothetical protein
MCVYVFVGCFMCNWSTITCVPEMVGIGRLTIMNYGFVDYNFGAGNKRLYCRLDDK